MFTSKPHPPGSSQHFSSADKGHTAWLGKASSTAILVTYLVLIALLAGCGFSLRPSVDYPFRTLYSSAPRYSPLGIELKRQLPTSGPLVYLTEPALPTDAQVVLDVYDELRKKTAIGVNATGQAREFQLSLTLKFRLRTPQGLILIPETTLAQQRTLSYDETLALAKEAEEAALYRSMQVDLVQQIVRRLAALDAEALQEPPLE